MGWFIHSKLQPLHHWSLVQVIRLFQLIISNGCNCWSMMGLKLIPVSKGGHRKYRWKRETCPLHRNTNRWSIARPVERRSLALRLDRFVMITGHKKEQTNYLIFLVRRANHVCGFMRKHPSFNTDLLNSQFFKTREYQRPIWSMSKGTWTQFECCYVCCGFENGF